MNDIMGRIKSFLVNYNNFIQVLFMLVFFILFGRSLLDPNIGVLISAMLLLVVQVWILTNTNAIHQKKEDLGIKAQQYEDGKDDDVFGKIGQAKHDLFMSSATLGKSIKHEGMYAGLAKSIDLRIMTLNNKDEDQLRCFCNMVGPSYDVDNMKSLIDVFYASIVKKNPNIKFKVFDRIVPISYFAVDILNPSKHTVIMAKIYFHCDFISPYITTIHVYPGNPLFDKFREQINYLWDHGSEYVPSRSKK